METFVDLHIYSNSTKAFKPVCKLMHAGHPDSVPATIELQPCNHVPALASGGRELRLLPAPEASDRNRRNLDRMAQFLADQGCRAARMAHLMFWLERSLDTNGWVVCTKVPDPAPPLAHAKRTSSEAECGPSPVARRRRAEEPERAEEAPPRPSERASPTAPPDASNAPDPGAGKFGKDRVDARLRAPLTPCYKCRTAKAPSAFSNTQLHKDQPACRQCNEQLGQPAAASVMAVASTTPMNESAGPTEVPAELGALLEAIDDIAAHTSSLDVHDGAAWLNRVGGALGGSRQHGGLWSGLKQKFGGGLQKFVQLHGHLLRQPPVGIPKYRPPTSGDGPRWVAIGSVAMVKAAFAGLAPQRDAPPAPSIHALSRDDLLGGVALHPTSTPLDATSSVGYRLLAKMGWREGTGLGRCNEGRTEPVAESLHHNELRTGLGADNVLTIRSVGAAEDALRRLLDTGGDAEFHDFPGLAKEERAHMHTAANNLGLTSQSFGRGESRFLRVYHPNMAAARGKLGKEPAGESMSAENGNDDGDGDGDGDGGAAPWRDELRRQAEEAAELLAPRAAAGNHRLGLGCSDAASATSLAGGSTRSGTAGHSAKKFGRAVRYSNLVEASLCFASLCGSWEADEVRTGATPDAETLVGYVNLCLRHTEWGDAWRAYQLARAAPASFLRLFAIGLDCSRLLEQLSEVAVEPTRLAHAIELWGEMHAASVPLDVEALQPFIERCVGAERYEVAFEAFLAALDAQCQPQRKTCEVLLGVGARHVEWARASYAVLVSMRSSGMQQDEYGRDCVLADATLLRDLADLLTRAEEQELAQDVLADLGVPARKAGPPYESSPPLPMPQTSGTSEELA